MEETLGANWLNKIGTAAFVIGVALLLNYSMHYLGPAGKIVLGYVLSATLLGIGIFGETKERYRIAARAVLGGGWALAYFTTYALHNVQSVRLVESAGLGFALLFAVAVAMVAHSLRYDSELATGFAYLLAFVTVAISDIPLGGLVASALLAASLVVILRVRRWFVVEPLAIVATYAVHYLLFAAAKLAKRELNSKAPGQTEKRKGGEAGLGYAWRSIEAYPQHLFFSCRRFCSRYW